MRFSQLMESKIKELGGFAKLREKLPSTDAAAISSWVCGVRVPGYAAQLELCDLLDVSLADLRASLDLPWTPFSEFLIKRIIPHGRSGDFPQKTGINKSSYEKWINQGYVPRSVKSAESIADALKLWGDPTPKMTLVAELLSAVEASIALKKTKAMP